MIISPIGKRAATFIHMTQRADNQEMVIVKVSVLAGFDSYPSITLQEYRMMNVAQITARIEALKTYLCSCSNATDFTPYFLDTGSHVFKSTISFSNPVAFTSGQGNKLMMVATIVDYIDGVVEATNSYNIASTDPIIDGVSYPRPKASDTIPVARDKWMAILNAIQMYTPTFANTMITP